jgi:solute carrier family 15 (peptide/histidine transporter), member 3/4
VAEILASITSLEFFYSQAPTSMRSVSQALNLFTNALGSWLTIPLLILVNSGLFGEEWVPENLDDGHLSRYFFLLAGLMVANQVTENRSSAQTM